MFTVWITPGCDLQIADTKDGIVPVNHVHFSCSKDQHEISGAVRLPAHSVWHQTEIMHIGGIHGNRLGAREAKLSAMNKWYSGWRKELKLKT